MPESILDMLSTSTNAPILDLRQVVTVMTDAPKWPQMCPGFAPLVSLPHLRSLHVQYSKVSDGNEELLGLLKGLFEVVNAHAHQLESLNIETNFSLDRVAADLGAVWDCCVSTDFTSSLIRLAKESLARFSVLRSLRLKSNAELFSVYRQEFVGLYCLFHYTYPALEALELDFPGTEKFFQHLSTENPRIKNLKCRCSPSSAWRNNWYAMLDFLRSFNGLEQYSIAATNYLSADVRPLLLALATNHGKTLSRLDLDYGIDVEFPEDKFPYFSRTFSDFYDVFPHLAVLRTPIHYPEDLIALGDASNFPLLNSIHVYELPKDRNQFAALFDLTSPSLLLDKPGMRDAFKTLFDARTHLRHLDVTSEQWLLRGFPAELDKYTSTMSRDRATGQITTRHPLSENLKARLRKLQKAAGVDFVPSEDIDRLEREVRSLLQSVCQRYVRAANNWDMKEH